MARNRKRQANGTAWYREFDNGWYSTFDVTRFIVPRLEKSVNQFVCGQRPEGSMKNATAINSLFYLSRSSTGDFEFISDKVGADIDRINERCFVDTCRVSRSAGIRDHRPFVPDLLLSTLANSCCAHLGHEVRMNEAVGVVIPVTDDDACYDALDCLKSALLCRSSAVG